MDHRHLVTAACACLLPGAALAQSSYVAPDGVNRYPGVTIFCAKGNGVQPCSFGSGSGSGSVTLLQGGNPVSTSNKLPVTDSALDALISGSALSVGGTVAVSGMPAVTLGAGSAAIGSVSVSNLPATQAISASALPLPSGAATAAQQAAVLAPVSPGSNTATASMLMGCLSNTTLPSFTAGQAGAVPCDTSGRPYVVTIPSQNNQPSYLQAISSGGATIYRAINTASSSMAANVKTSSGLIYGYEACNAGSSAAYFRIFGLSTTPVAGTSTPSIVKILPAGNCQNFSTAVGLTIPNGIGVDVTTGSQADTDSTAISAANQVTVELYYK